MPALQLAGPTRQRAVLASPVNAGINSSSSACTILNKLLLLLLQTEPYTGFAVGRVYSKHDDSATWPVRARAEAPPCSVPERLVCRA